MHITMVTRKMPDGSNCRKCEQAIRLLKARGLWDKIDKEVCADPNDPDGEGMKLAEDIGAAKAPFFIVDDDCGRKVYFSVLRLMRDVLQE